MAYEQKDGDISIFKNNKKATEKQPDYTGTAIVDGKKRKIALWIKGDESKFFAGKIEEDTYRQSDNIKPISNGLAQQLDDDFAF
jgi:hypothetical protein